MGDTPKHSVSVAGIVVDDQNRVLVIKRRDNGHWEPPGGVLELAETPEDGVRREVLEETGIAVEVCGLSGVYKNMPRGIIALVYRCRPISGNVTSSLETSAVKWLSIGEVEELMDDAYAVRVADAFSAEAQSRNHDGKRLLSTSTEAQR